MNTDNCFLIIPASGIGKRMNEIMPKQYLKLDNGKSIIDQCLKTLLSIDRITACVVAVAAEDDQFKLSPYFNHPKILSIVTGGKERHLSVFNALNSLSNIANNNDWILVHDAVRPCILSEDIENLIDQVFDHPVGGILATRIIDTVKQISSQKELSTIDRKTLYHAQTPQMFRFGILNEALKKSIEFENIITDESEAIENLGHSIKIVKGSKSNIKITQTDDLKLANYYLK
jgi:2-C-methyl-D-erythritol 4-phosphate cytidylyltransferase